MVLPPICTFTHVSFATAWFSVLSCGFMAMKALYREAGYRRWTRQRDTEQWLREQGPNVWEVLDD